MAYRAVSLKAAGLIEKTRPANTPHLKRQIRYPVTVPVIRPFL
jgi:hypothetical protein